MSNITDVETLFETLKINKITAKKLSQETGISQGNISDWRHGKSQPSLASLQKINGYLSNLEIEHKENHVRTIYKGKRLRTMALPCQPLSSLPSSESDSDEERLKYYGKIIDLIRNMETYELETAVNVLKAIKK